MTLDTKALQAAVGTADNRNRCLVCDWPLAESADKGCVPGDCSYRPNGEEWSRIQAKREFYARVKQEVLATRSQSLPDELTAIAERWDKHLRAMRVAEKLPGFKGWQDWERDIAALLSFIPDVVRACAGIARGEVYKDRYRTWVHWKVQPDGTRGNVWHADALATHCDDLAEQILSILDHSIKSESQIREEERERCANLVRALRGPIDTANLKGGAAYQLGLQDAEINIRNGKTEG